MPGNRNRSCSELGLIILEKTRKTLDLFDQVLIGCLFINETGLIREANFTAALFLGFEMESLINAPVSALMDPQSHETFCRHQEETYLSGAPRICDLTLKRRDGTMASVRLQSIASECIGERAIRSALIDITDRRRAEEKATRQKAMLQGINRILEEGERGGSDRALGETCLTIAKEITGSTFGFIGQTGPDGLLRDIAMTSPGAEFCSIRDRAGCQRTVGHGKAPDLYSRVLRDGESVLTNSPSEHHDMVSDPAGYPLLKTFLGVPLIREGRTIGIIAVGNREQGYTLHDQEALETLAPSVVEAFARREAEKALRKARVDLLKQCVDENRALLKDAYDRLAERAHGSEGEDRLCRHEKMEALGGLAGAMAHNFNNILAAVIGFTELAVENVPAQSMEAEFLGKVLQAGCRGRDLIQQMLLFSGKARGESKPVCLGSAVKEAMEGFSSSVSPIIYIRTKIPSKQDLALADPEQIQQVVLNLCDNAAYAMRETGGTLDVDVSAKGEPVPLKQGLYMKLTVKDTGPGIAPENLDRIFDPFFTTKPPSLGVGLGLSVVQSIVHRHGGHITVKSEPGRGTIFTVYFRKADEMQAVRDHIAADVPVAGHLERILFVDDEEMIAEIGRQILERLGYRVVSATSSREALSIFQENPSRFDFVITDQTMPDMTGLDLTREILKLRPDIPIVLCTGFSQFVDADTAQRAGVRAFAMKPLVKDELARTIRSVLDG